MATDSVWIFKGMGTHYFQVQLQVGKAGGDWLLAWRVTFLPFGSDTERLPPPTGDPGQ